MITFSILQLTSLTTLLRESGYICLVCQTCWIAAQDIIRLVWEAHSAREPTHPPAQGIWIARWGAHKPVWAWTTRFPHPQQCSHPAHHSGKVRGQIEREKSFVTSVETCFAHVEKNNIVWRIKSASVLIFLVDLKIFFFYYPFSWNEKYKWHIIYTFYCYKFEIVMIWLRVQVKLRKIFRSKRWPNNSDWQMMQSNANLRFFLGPFFCVLNTEESF